MHIMMSKPVQDVLFIVTANLIEIISTEAMLYYSFEFFRSTLCCDEPAHVTPLEKICDGSWAPLVYFSFCI